jgi:transcriptional regulator with XRE-family HTH domain
VKRKSFDSIEAYRESVNATQQELAAALGITQGALSMIESGQRVPRPELALLINSTTGVPLEVLLRRKAS